MPSFFLFVLSPFTTYIVSVLQRLPPSCPFTLPTLCTLTTLQEIRARHFLRYSSSRRNSLCLLAPQLATLRLSFLRATRKIKTTVVSFLFSFFLFNSVPYYSFDYIVVLCSTCSYLPRRNEISSLLFLVRFRSSSNELLEIDSLSTVCPVKRIFFNWY